MSEVYDGEYGNETLDLQLRLAEIALLCSAVALLRRARPRPLTDALACALPSPVLTLAAAHRKSSHDNDVDGQLGARCHSLTEHSNSNLRKNVEHNAGTARAPTRRGDLGTDVR